MSDHTYCFERPDGVEVEVDYEVVSWGAPASHWHPAEDMEIELGAAHDAETGAVITLTAEEANAVERAIYANPPEPDLGPDE